MNGHPLVGTVIIAALTLIDYFLELAKASFENISCNTLEKLTGDEEHEDLAKTAKEALEFVDAKERSFLNAVRAAMGISLIADGIAYSRHIADCLYERSYAFHGNGVLPVIYVIAATIVFMYLVVLFSHIIPDRLGSLRAEKYFFRMFGLMKMITVLFAPIGSCLEAGCHILLKLVGVDADAEDVVTEDEIVSMVNESHEQGVLEAEEAAMITNIIEFDEKQTRDIMTHRTKIVAVDSEMDIESAMKFMAKQSFSRFPLYTGDIDNIVGVIHLKDVVKCYAGNNYKSRTLLDISRKPLMVPDTLNIDDLFHEMQNKNVHMAIVIDEYGQTAGIVAMEDILEEIVGNIQDEFDNEEQLIRKCNDTIWLVLGETRLDELNGEIGLEPDDDDMEDFETLNGLLISKLGRIPADDEKATLEYNGFRFDILETKRKMIRKVRVTKLEEAPEAGEDQE